MNVSLWPVRKSIRMYPALMAVLLISALSCFSQDIGTRTWKATVFTDSQKVKGILFQVTDNSLVLRLPDRTYDEIFFKSIHKIRLRRLFGAGTTDKWVGFLAGAVTGAVIGATAATRGRSQEGEGRAYAGMYGGFVGFLLGGGIGIVVDIPAYWLMSAKIYIVPRDPLLYPSFAAKLRRRSLRR